ncbi:MAG: DUF4907 domain-containing protein [Bacteroidota bacterium]
MRKPLLFKLGFFCITTIIILNSCNQAANQLTSAKKDVYMIKLLKMDSSGWCYDIYKNDKITIHQPNIPAVDGNFAFKSKEDAIKTAALVVEKLKKNIFPPSLSLEEVKTVIK